MEAFVTRHYRVVFIVCMGAIAGLSFYVGILEGKQSGRGGVTLSCSDAVLSSLRIPTKALSSASVPTVAGASATSQDLIGPDTPTPPATTGAFAGSKNGTKYYTPGCAGLDRIKPENIIWFQTAEDATLQGYTPAQC